MSPLSSTSLEEEGNTTGTWTQTQKQSTCLHECRTEPGCSMLTVRGPEELGNGHVPPVRAPMEHLRRAALGHRHLAVLQWGCGPVPTPGQGEGGPLAASRRGTDHPSSSCSYGQSDKAHQEDRPVRGVPRGAGGLVPRSSALPGGYHHHRHQAAEYISPRRGPSASGVLLARVAHLTLEESCTEMLCSPSCCLHGMAMLVT
ncbi:uncharacterized protein LOC134490181 [Candoia aspera]|uniref:uncharacterized protein LOC134490181 n=1 Tax=Candoia aspera TaxID=51853 RepID=UPI002FD7D545